MRHNLHYTDVESKRDYNLKNYLKDEITITFYVDEYKLSKPLRVGILTSKGIEYIDNIELNQFYYIKGEVETERYENLYVRFSQDIEYKIMIRQQNTLDSIEVFQYDKNNQLIKESKLISHLDIASFSAEDDTLYGIVKINYYENFTWGRYHEVHELKLGESISVDLADTFGIMIQSSTFRFRIQYENVIYI